LEKIKIKLYALKWAVCIAWKFDKWKFIWCFTLGGLLALLPSISLVFNRQVISGMSAYLTTGTGSFESILPTLIAYGVTLTLIGISSRVNSDLIYMMMYDSYYLCMLELAMDKIPQIKMSDLLKRDINDKYSFTIWRPGALTDIISALCQIVSKFIMIISILIVAYDVSKVVFFGTIIYVLLTFIINVVITKDDRFSWDVLLGFQRNAGYYEDLPYKPGVAKETRMFQNTEKLIEQWRKKYKVVEDFHLDKAKDLERRNFISGIIFYIFLILVIIYSLLAVANRTMTPDVFLVLYSICMGTYNGVSGFAQDILILDRGLQAADNQREFYSMPIFKEKEVTEHTFSKKDEQIVFKAKNIKFGYTDKTVLNNVSFEVKKGEIIALVGSNGSGKSTLTKLLLGMFEPNSGKMWFYGEDYKNLSIHAIRKFVGTFFQNFFIFHHTIKENVGYGDIKNVQNEEKVYEALKKGGALGIINKMPNGIDSILKCDVDKSGVILSGGEGQRIAVSRSHMSDKEVLIFDEPAAMLDPLAEMEQFMNIKDTLQGRTAILISHRIGFARLADRVFMMKKGKIVEAGSHEELIAKNGDYAYFFNEQAQWYKTGGENNESAGI